MQRIELSVKIEKSQDSLGMTLRKKNNQLTVETVNNENIQNKFKCGDRILSINGQSESCQNSKGFVKEMKTFHIGDEIHFVIEREISILKSFPESLPGLPNLEISALGVRKTNLDYQITVNGELWVHDATRIENITDSALLDFVQCLGLELPISGQISILHNLTLDSDAKRDANIPESADSFCWCNPIALSDTSRQLMCHLDTNARNNKDVALFLYGGFLYFAGNHLVQCNSLIPANDGLFFGEPIKFDANHRSIQSELVSAGRLHEVTIEPFRQRGAKYFCWLLPGEYDLCDHGGFLYLFGDTCIDHHEKDCFFQVLGGAERELKLQEASALVEQGMLKDTDQEEIKLQEASTLVEQGILKDADQEEKRRRLEQMRSWDVEVCCKKLAEAGLEEDILQILRENNIEGPDLATLPETPI